jgi:hypothetical protein
MYHTGLDPMTGQELHVARTSTERHWQHALMLFFKPESYTNVRQALEAAGRTDLIGDGPDCLIPSRPPKRCKEAKPNRQPIGRSSDAGAAGYRPHRKTARRQNRD